MGHPQRLSCEEVPCSQYHIFHGTRLDLAKTKVQMRDTLDAFESFKVRLWVTGMHADQCFPRLPSTPPLNPHPS